MFILEKVKRIFIWFKRFRKRKGYGVHSPFAFNFITQVIYEKGVYYNYSLLNQLPHSKVESDKVIKLLFRLVNFISPHTILYKHRGDDISDIFRWAKSDVHILGNVKNSCKLDFVYLEMSYDNKELENILTEIIPIMHKDSILIIYGIGFNKERMEFWSKVISHPNSGISFDLYDLGILFFDHSKNKQDYIVNF